MLIVTPPWQAAGSTTIRPSSSTNSGASAANAANAYDASLTTFARLTSDNATPLDCQVTYTGFPTAGGSTLPNAGTLTVRRGYAVTRSGLQGSATTIDISLNGGSTWTNIDFSPFSTTTQAASDVTYAVPSGQSIANIRVRCTASNSSDGTISGRLDVYDIRIDY